MDGYELAVKLRHATRKPLRLIALTGYGQDQDRERCAQAGFDAHIVKPVEIDDLDEVLRSSIVPEYLQRTADPEARRAPCV